jgi:hypothetical protein
MLLNEHAVCVFANTENVFIQLKKDKLMLSQKQF